MAERRTNSIITLLKTMNSMSHSKDATIRTEARVLHSQPLLVEDRGLLHLRKQSAEGNERDYSKSTEQDFVISVFPSSQTGSIHKIPIPQSPIDPGSRIPSYTSQHYPKPSPWNYNKQFWIVPFL